MSGQIHFIPGAVATDPDHTIPSYGQLFNLPASPSGVSLPPTFRYQETVPRENQGNYGTCVGHGTAYMLTYRVLKQTGKLIRPSRLFTYEESKKLDGKPKEQGTQPGIAMQVVKTKGICYESSYSYSLCTDQTIYNLPVPTAQSFTEAQEFLAVDFAKLQTDVEIKTAILNEGPVGFAILVASDFFTPEAGGFVDLPEGSIVGGHWICCIGWDDNLTHTYKDGTKRTGFYRMINSWGDGWADNGFCWIPYDFVHGKLDIGTPYLMESWTFTENSIKSPVKAVNTIEMWVNHPTAMVNGTEVPLDVAPSFDKKANRVSAPVRFMAENLGALVEWDQNDGKVTIIQET